VVASRDGRYCTSPSSPQLCGTKGTFKYTVALFREVIFSQIAVIVSGVGEHWQLV
jgi:hypothetical protein